MIRPLLVISSLLLTVVVCAQEVVSEVDLEYRKESKQYLHDGKPLKGCYKVKYFDDDFVWRYYIADFQKGLRGDTVRYYDAKSNSLFRVLIRVNDSETLHLEYFFGGTQLFEQYRTIDGKREGLYKEWYNNGVLCRTRQYVGGLLNGESCYWDDRGRLEEVLNYKDNLQDGWSKYWIYEDYMSGAPLKQMVRSLYNEGGSAILEERYDCSRERPILIKRTIFDSPIREPKYVAFKDECECDSTRMDSLENSIEIRDYRQGKLLSIERYTYDLERDGVFETYNIEGRMASRKRYERDRLIAESYYEPNELSPDVQQITLTSDMCVTFKLKSCNSKYFDKCDTESPLVIRDPFGNELFSVSDEGRRYEYYGYDPKLKYHLAFSSVGDFNDVYYYVVHDDGASMSLSVDYVAVNGDAGTVATMRRIFDDEDELVIYNFRPENKEEGFIPVLKYSVRHAAYLTDLHWLGNGTLLLEYKDGGIRLDVNPAELELTDDDESY